MEQKILKSCPNCEHVNRVDIGMIKKALCGICKAPLMDELSAGDIDVQLVEAVKTGAARSVKELLEKGANPNTIVRGYDAHKGSVFIQCPLLIHAMSVDFFGIKRENKSLDVIALLLEYGADPNSVSKHNNTAMILSVCDDTDFSTKAIRLLIQAGADINHVGEFDKTALDKAWHGFQKGWTKDKSIIQLLIENGAKH